ncbi:MAG: hypothetical protein NZ518_08670, partial [Dehalococcoidia bacterium]|nr:hypothetical protein [Dehalococcoidia bacterium]
LLSEFGLQAAPVASSLAQVLPDAPAPGPAWEARNAQVDKLLHYAAPFGARTDDPDSCIRATQRAQAAALQIAIEHQRRRGDRAAGVLFWQWNEPWGAISWSVIDFYGRPKAALAGLRSWYAPLLPSLEYPLRRYAAGDRFVGTLWLVNDTLRPWTELDCRLISGDREVARRPAVAAANDVVCLGPVDVTLAAPTIRIEVWRRGVLVAANAYDLDWRDLPPMRRWDRFKDWVTWRSVR